MLSYAAALGALTAVPVKRSAVVASVAIFRYVFCFISLVAVATSETNGVSQKFVDEFAFTVKAFNRYNLVF